VTTVHGRDPSFEIAIEQVGDHSVVVVRGEVDVGATDALWRCVDSVRSSGRPVVIDLAETTFMDVSGIKVLLHTYAAQGRAPEAVTLRAPTDAVTRVLELTGVDDLFRIEHPE
jgi:anti-anti-sigma factor